MITVLDGHTTNPGDLSWEALEALGETTVYDRTPPGLVVERARGASIVLTNKTRLPAEVLAQLPGLRYVGVLATGYDVVDVEAAAERGVVVCNVPAYSTESVAQIVWAHVLNLASDVAGRSDDVRAGGWSGQPDFAYWTASPLELHGLTLGVVGYGRIGSAVARIGRAFGMRVLAYAPRPKQAEGVEFVGLDRLFAESDVVTLHCPLTPETRGLVDAERLAAMKPSAYLINTGRGPLVDEAALEEALRTGQIAGAGLDVLSQEPPPEGHPLLSAPNCVITPHIAWASKAARERLLGTAVANVAAFLGGKPQNVVQNVLA
jgi:glycerate dehydrogenase